MSKKEEIIEKLNELIFNFEDSTGIVNYAIIFNSRIVLSPNASHLTKEGVKKILKNLNIDKLEESFQSGEFNLLQIQFENDTSFFLKSTPEVCIIASPKNKPPEEMKKKLLDFNAEIRRVIKRLSEPVVIDETELKINQGLAKLEKIIADFKIPKFQSFKKLVKYALPFQKNK